MKLLVTKILLLVFTGYSFQTELQYVGDNVCQKREIHNTTRYVNEIKRIRVVRPVKCSFLSFKKKCEKAYWESRVVKTPKVIVTEQIINKCCDGYKELRGRVIECLPFCSYNCGYIQCLSQSVCVCHKNSQKSICDPDTYMKNVTKTTEKSTTSKTTEKSTTSETYSTEQISTTTSTTEEEIATTTTITQTNISLLDVESENFTSEYNHTTTTNITDFEEYHTTITDDYNITENYFYQSDSIVTETSILGLSLVFWICFSVFFIAMIVALIWIVFKFRNKGNMYDTTDEEGKRSEKRKKCSAVYLCWEKTSGKDLSKETSEILMKTQRSISEDNDINFTV